MNQRKISNWNRDLELLGVWCGRWMESKINRAVNCTCSASSEGVDRGGGGETLRVFASLTTRSWPRNASFMLSFRRKWCGTRVCVWGTRQLQQLQLRPSKGECGEDRGVEGKGGYTSLSFALPWWPQLNKHWSGISLKCRLHGHVVLPPPSLPLPIAVATCLPPTWLGEHAARSTEMSRARSVSAVTRCKHQKNRKKRLNMPLEKAQADSVTEWGGVGWGGLDVRDEPGRLIWVYTPPRRGVRWVY